MLQGEKIYLRPLTSEDLAFLEARANDEAYLSEFNVFGLRRPNGLEQGLAEDGLISARYGMLMVVTHAHQVVGDISYHQARYGPNEASVAYNIGIVLAPEQRGQGYGVEAQRLLAEYLFLTYPIMRVEASTDVENRPEQRALEKAGFTREGVLRQSQWRGGKWHDLVLYSKLRGEM